MDIHPTAAAGFAAAAAVYERARPTYAPEAIDWIRERTGLGAGLTVLDLGAGTGKLTRMLTATGARVVAVEPVPEMLAELRRVVPVAEPLEATAEAIPLADGSVDVVTAGQAFHWFEPERALAEMHRVLASDGWVALVWNMRDLDDPLHRRIDDVLLPYRRELTPARAFTWRTAVEESPLFGELEHRVFSNPVTTTRADLRERFASTSFIAAMPSSDGDRLLDELVALAGDRPEPFDFRYVTEAFTFPRSRDLASRGRGTSFKG